MIAYKGFLPGLICRGYQFRMGLNVTEKANCAHNGFHCAEDPLDCLRYYGDINHAEYYIVDAGGDIDEDGVDSKISCTELTILKRLTKKELFLHGLAFMADHPKRKWNSNIKVDKAEAWNGYAGGIQQIVVAEIDGKTLQPGIWYGVELEKRMVN